MERLISTSQSLHRAFCI